MQFLLDTHVCLWAVAEPNKLPKRVKDIVEDFENKIIYSHTSLFKIAIKYSTGRLPEFNVSLAEFNDVLLKKGFDFLPVSNEHLYSYFNCKFFSEDHGDPFDRMLLANALTEKAAILTKDDKFHLYKEWIEIVW